MFALLLQESLPRPHNAAGDVPLDWMKSVFSWECSDLLRSTLSALTSGWHAHLDGRQDLSARSRHAYGRALGHLRRALTRIGQNSNQDLQILASIELLALYELFEYGAANNQGWITHLTGAENILQIRYHEVETTTIFRQIFQWHRMVAVSKSIIPYYGHSLTKIMSAGKRPIHSQEDILI